MIPINRNPSSRTLRQFSAAWIVFIGLAGWMVLHQTGTMWVAVVLWSASVLIGTMGLARPQWIRPVYLGLSYAAWPIGIVVSTTVLAVIYYFILTPTGVIMRLLGRDPLQRRADPTVKTYWAPHRGPDDAERYFRQF